MILEQGPSHTTDISQAKADLDKFGYCIIPEVLSDDEIETAKQRLLEQAEAEEELGLSFRDGGAGQEVKFKDGRVDKDSFSTQNGEELMIARKYKILKEKFPELFLIVVPRHVERCKSIIEEISKEGLDVELRSNLDRQLGNRETNKAIDCLIINTTGELGAWYYFSDVVIIGKSFLHTGGQNPVEAILGWSTRLGAYRSHLRYEKEKLVSFEVSPPINDSDHRINPIGLESTLDPVSSMLWFLNDREFTNLCKGRIRILDGFRLSEVAFHKKINVNEGIKCVGFVKKIAGFKPKFNSRKISGFNVLYSPTVNNKFEVLSFDFDTFLGRVSANNI